MPAERTLLLDHERVQRKLRRIAIQLQEEHWNAGSLVLAGIAPRGTKLAQRLARMLAEGSQLQVDVMELTLDKDAPLARPPKSSLEPSALRGRTVVLVDDVLMSGRTLSGESVRAILVVMLAHRYIWENESKARAGGDDQDKLLKLTHSINGVRNNAKNVLAREFGERLDWKVDCFAAELVAQFGNWNVFDAAE